MGITFPSESPEYRAARDRLLQQEVDLRRQMETVAAARRDLPPGGAIPEDYLFHESPNGGQTNEIHLSELFAPGRDTLVVYNMMFPRHAEDDRPGPTDGQTAVLPLAEGPCPSCTSLLDQLEGAADHLAPLVNFVVIAKAPAERIGTWARERGWRRLRLVSSAGTSFKRDYHGETEDGSQVPVLNVFHRDGDVIRHFWSSELFFEPTEPGQDPRHAGTLEPLWNVLDLTPEGRGPDWDEQLSYPA
jgi:predicted dithiol-disulfide oxidoreductase (DUF899 family)